MPHHETEIKLKVLNARNIKRALAGLGFVITGRRHFEQNFLFDFPDLRLRNSRSVIRLRHEGKRSILTFKGPPIQSPGYKVRSEIETEVQDGRRLREILEFLGLRAVFCYEKYRTTYTPGHWGKSPSPGVVVFDETPIGNFLELEGPKRWIDAVARQLGFARTDYMTSSYTSLYHTNCRENGEKPGNMVFSRLK